jgi:ATP-dependent DNA helicase RecQ
MLRPGTTLVISPLVALMKDQVDSLERRGLPATFINSSLSHSDQAQRLDALAHGAYRMVLVAPERLRSRAFLEALGRVGVSTLAVDEAHCVSLWGHDFRPDYLHLAEARLAFGQPVTLALTATATRQVQADILRLLGLPQAETVVTGFNRPNLRLEVQPAATKRARLEHTRAALAEAGGAAIIYASTRREAEGLAAELRERAGVAA